MSDWDGVHDTREAALNGLDLEMGTERNYNDFYLAQPYLDGLKSGDISDGRPGRKSPAQLARDVRHACPRCWPQNRLDQYRRA